MGASSQSNLGGGAATIACKIKPDTTGQCDFQVSAADLPVGIQLCQDKTGKPAASAHFFEVKVFLHNTTNPAPTQPSQLTNTTCKLPALPVGLYDVQVAVLHRPGAIAFVYEACTNPDFTNPLCGIDTSIDPDNDFCLRVV